MKGSAQSGVLNHLIAFGKFHCSSKKKKNRISEGLIRVSVVASGVVGATRL